MKKFATYYDNTKILCSFSATFLMFKNFVNMALVPYKVHRDKNR